MTGRSIKEYILVIKFSKAIELLEQPDKKIQDVAKAVGIDSPAYFSKFFKKNSNMTPQEYRSAKFVKEPD